MRIEVELIRRFDITSRYKGYYLLTEALQIARENYDNCQAITKDVYQKIAQRHRTTYMCVERNIRTVVAKCWENNRKLMEEIAGHELTVYPSNGAFLDMVIYWFESNNDDSAKNIGV